MWCHTGCWKKWYTGKHNSDLNKKKNVLILKQQSVKSVLNVKPVLLDVVSAYGPDVGIMCPHRGGVVMSMDINGHNGEWSRSNEEVLCRCCLVQKDGWWILWRGWRRLWCIPILGMRKNTEWCMRVDGWAHWWITTCAEMFSMRM